MTAILRLSLVFVCGLGAVPALSAQSAPSTDKLDRAAQEAIEKQKLVGTAVAVVMLRATVLDTIWTLAASSRAMVPS